MLALTEVIAHDVQTDHRAGRMLEALIGSSNKGAKVVLTVDLASGEGSRYHQTFSVRTWTTRDTNQQMLSVEVTGSGSYESGIRPIKMYHVNLDNLRVSRANDPRNADALLRYAADAALAYAWLGEAGLPVPGNGTVTVMEESTCGHCGKALTDPVSIERGVGPTCLAKATGTHTITGRTA